MDFSSFISSSVPLYFVAGPLCILIVSLIVLAVHKASPLQPGVPVALVDKEIPSPGTVPQTSEVPASQAQVAPATSISAPMTSPIPEPVVPYVSPVTEAIPVVAEASPLVVSSSQVQASSSQDNVSIEQPHVAKEVVPVAPQPAPEVLQEQNTPTPAYVSMSAPIATSEPVPEAILEPVSMPATTPIAMSEHVAASTPQIDTSIPTPVTPGGIPPVSSWKPVEAVVVPVDVTRTEAQMQAEAVKVSV